jgi:hypothetical protein
MTRYCKLLQRALLLLLSGFAGLAGISAEAQVLVRIADGMSVEAKNVGIALTGSIDASGSFDTRGATITFNQTDGSGGIALPNGLGIELVEAAQFEGTTISGPVQLQGTLRVRVAPGALIEEGTTFVGLTCSGGCSGTFDNIESSFAVSVGYSTHAVSVTALETYSTAADTPDITLQNESWLLGAFPNPFTQTTTLRMELDSPGVLIVEAYDLLGRRVDVVADGYLLAGSHEIRWTPPVLASGVYMLSARADQRLIGVWRVTLRR